VIVCGLWFGVYCLLFIEPFELIGRFVEPLELLISFIQHSTLNIQHHQIKAPQK
jgi:hypothetical protein